VDSLLKDQPLYLVFLINLIDKGLASESTLTLDQDQANAHKDKLVIFKSLIISRSIPISQSDTSKIHTHDAQLVFKLRKGNSRGETK